MNWREPATANVVAVRLRATPQLQLMSLWCESMVIKYGDLWVTAPHWAYLNDTAHLPTQPWIAVRP